MPFIIFALTDIRVHARVVLCAVEVAKAKFLGYIIAAAGCSVLFKPGPRLPLSKAIQRFVVSVSVKTKKLKKFQDLHSEDSTDPSFLIQSK